MTDDELDTLVALAAQPTDSEVASWPLGTSVTDLREAVMSTADTDGDITAAAAATAPRSSRRRTFARVAAAAAAITAVALIVPGGGGSGGSGSAWAAPLIAFAEGSPRLLIDAPGWEVVRAHEYGDEGEMTFAGGDREADLHWRSESLASLIDGREASGARVGTHDVVGGTATIVQYEGSTDFTAMWSADGQTLEFRAMTLDLEEFETLLDALYRVDVDTWLSAMPESVIELGDRAAVVAEMLADIPLPAGFDAAELADGPMVTDRYHLGATVVSAVSCRWIEQWLDATAAGDTAAADEALAAMAGSSEWAVIQEMNESGAYGEVLQDHVDAMITGEPLVYGKEFSLAETYVDALGCHR